MAGDVHTWGVLEADQWVRQRVKSMDTSLYFRKVDQPWRPRVFSVRVKYGRQRRIVTDEFDILLEKGMKRMCNDRPALQSQIQRFIWSHQESDADAERRH